MALLRESYGESEHCRREGMQAGASDGITARMHNPVRNALMPFTNVTDCITLPSGNADHLPSLAFLYGLMTTLLASVVRSQTRRFLK